MRKTAKRVFNKLQITLRPLRAVPDFILVGAQKAGTTALFELLSQHHEIIPATVKEVHFFDVRFDRGVTWYRSQFPFRATLQLKAWRLGAPVLTGESTPYYLFHPLAPKRIKATCPNVKILILLRDPVDRAISHYHFNVRRGVETQSFEQALAYEQEVLDKAEQDVLSNKSAWNKTHQNCSYLGRGEYADQVKRYLEIFGRENVHVGFSAQYFADPVAYAQEVLSFLGLTPEELNDVGARNSGNYNRELPSGLEQELRRHFRDHDRKLAKLLDCELPWRPKT